MPVDFLRVPPKAKVPDVSPPSIVGWTLLLCLMLVGCATGAAFVWPAGKRDGMLFWFCAVGAPIFAWGFLLVGRVAHMYGCVNSALATNKVSDAIETQCHESSSQPLAVLGHVWRFSSREEENCIDALVDGRTRLRPVSSQARPNVDVIARWLDVPGRQFYKGSALTEYARQTEACEWLLNQLMGGIEPQVLGLLGRTPVKVDLCIDSVLDPITVGERLLSILKNTLHNPRIEISPPRRELSLFHVDSWFDDTRFDGINLLVAVQLRNAASETLANGVAEAGSMLLVSNPSVARRMGEAPQLRIHRPARGSSAGVANTLELAIRWGRASFEKIGTTWRSRLTEESARTIDSSCRFARVMGTVDLDATVGDGGVASTWLAITLAAANAASTNEPQLVVTQEGNDLLALVCEKQI